MSRKFTSPRTLKIQMGNENRFLISEPNCTKGNSVLRCSSCNKFVSKKFSKYTGDCPHCEAPLYVARIEYDEK